MVTQRPDAAPHPAGRAVAHPAFPAGPGGLVVAAPAKVNLFLEVLGKRPDGYHELETLIAAVDLYDTLELRPADAPGVRLACDRPDLPTGPDNLVVKAADRLRAYVGRPELGADARLVKRIPAQAGLAGGSSDAAAALVGLNRVWGLGLGKADLASVAADVGSDVAVFLDLPAGWCTGRGEVVEPEVSVRAFDLVLVCPAVGLSTADVFRRLTVPAAPQSGAAARAAFRAGDPEALGRALANRLQEPAFSLSPPVAAVHRRLAGSDPAGCLMSGSGSTVFALCRDRREAVRIADAIRTTRPPDEAEPLVLVVRTLAPRA